MPETLTGRCLCGAVSFEIDRLSEGPVACHCRECQRQSGSAFWAAVTAARDAVRIASERLGWVRLSQAAWRGFCIHRPMRTLKRVVMTLSVLDVFSPMFGATAAPEIEAARASVMSPNPSRETDGDQRDMAEPL